MQPAQSGRVLDTERNRRVAPVYSGATFIVEQEVAGHTYAVSGEQARDLMHVVFNGIRQHVRKHGGQEDKVEAVVRKWETVCRGGRRPMRIVSAARQIGAMKAKIGMLSRDGSLAPCDRFRVNFDAIVTAGEISDQADREIANTRSDIENPVLWSKALHRELCSRGLARVSKCFRPQCTVIVDTQVGRRQQRVASPTHDALHWCHDAIGCPARTTGQSPPNRSSLHC